MSGPISATEDALVPAVIASVLGITVYTCRGYVKTLLKKLGVTTRLDAVLKAQHLGRISPG